MNVVLKHPVRMKTGDPEVKAGTKLPAEAFGKSLAYLIERGIVAPVEEEKADPKKAEGEKTDTVSPTMPPPADPRRK